MLTDIYTEFPEITKGSLNELSISLHKPLASSIVDLSLIRIRNSSPPNLAARFFSPISFSSLFEDSTSSRSQNSSPSRSL